MNSKYHKLAVAALIAGFVMGPQHRAFADSSQWWQQLFGNQTQNNNTNANTNNNSSSWQFGNRNNQTLTQEQIQADPNLARDQNSVQNDQAQLKQLYQNLRDHQQAGLDTSADLQAIANQKQSYMNDMNQYRADMNVNPNAQELTRNQNSIENDRQQLRGLYEKLNQDQRAGVDTTADLQAIANQKQSYINDVNQYRASGGNNPHYTNDGFGFDDGGRNSRPWQQNGNQGYSRGRNNWNGSFDGNGDEGNRDRFGRHRRDNWGSRGYNG